MKPTVVALSYDAVRAFLRVNGAEMDTVNVVVMDCDAHGRDFSGVVWVVGSPDERIMRLVRRNSDRHEGTVKFANIFEKVDFSE